jgi:hypothetical protein
MMLWLKRVIAQLLGHQTPPLDNPVEQMQTAGPVSKVHTTKAGNKPSAVTSTKLPKSVTPKSNSKRKVAPLTKVASSRKAEPKSAQAEHGQSGKQRKTPVRQTPQVAKSAPKRKP